MRAIFLPKDEFAESKHWRLNRDSTTRGKEKIVDTSLTLSYGKIISLGFDRVARETASEIHNVTKDQLMELANIYSTEKTTNSEEYVKSTLKNSAFCMSERASQLLSEWREEMLKDVDENMDPSPILSFHCIEHV